MTTALEIVAALRKHYPPDRFALLEEVANGTGSYVARHIDVLVMGLWPSRGLDITGIEVKVSRADFKRELEDPEKAEAIARYCDFWCLAAPDGVIDQFLVPANWGLLTIGPRGVTAARDPVRLEPKPLSRTFLAAILRKAQTPESLLSTIRLEEEQKVRANVQAELAERSELARSLRQAQTRLGSLEASVQRFEEATGISLESPGGWLGERQVGDAVNWLAANRADAKRAFGRVASDAERMAAKAREFEALLTEPDAPQGSLWGAKG